MSESKLKKIMFYIDTMGGGGGAERVMTNLASQFAEDGYDVTLTTIVKTENEYAISPKVKRMVYDFGLSTEKSLFKRIKRIKDRIFNLRNFFKTEKPDLVVTFMNTCNLYATLASTGLKNKNIISVRNTPETEYPGKTGLFTRRFILPLASGCVFQTEDAKNGFPVKLQKKSAIIFNAVKPVFFDITRKPVVGNIITCGRLAEQKNHVMLINAVNELHKKYPEINLKIYGQGELENELKNHIKELKAESFIKLMGFCRDVPEILSQAEIFAFTSNFEGMPNALMEAMAAGLPCISTDCPCGGPKALITNMKNGILIPVGDTEALIKQLEFLFLNKDKAKEIGDNAKKRALDFMPDKIYKDWKNYFESVVNK